MVAREGIGDSWGNYVVPLQSGINQWAAARVFQIQLSNSPVSAMLPRSREAVSRRRLPVVSLDVRSLNIKRERSAVTAHVFIACP